MTSSDPSRSLMQKAVAFHQKGQIPEAETSYREVLALYPRHVDALRFLGSLYAQGHKTDRAIECFESALEVDPRHPELLNNLGVALYSQGRIKDALLRYEQAIEEAPDYCDAMNNLGNLFYEAGKLGDALHWLERSLSLNAKNPRAHIILGHIYRQQENKEQAVFHYKKALGFWPENAEALTSLRDMA